MIDVPLQLLLVVETSDEDKSDAIYINEVLKTYFDTINVNVQFIYLKGKTNYNQKKIVNQIKNLTKMFYGGTHGQTVVIYFIDTDSTKKQYDKGSIFSNIIEFTKQNGFELVWFCKNSENVFLNKEPNQIDNKTEVAKEFARTSGITTVNQSNLNKNEIEMGCSNILDVLCKYLPNKKEKTVK